VFVLEDEYRKTQKELKKISQFDLTTNAKICINISVFTLFSSFFIIILYIFNNYY